MVNNELDPKLILAAEEFSDEEFKVYHVFSQYEDKIIRKLISHSPVLLRGGRGSGKSTLLKEAYFRTKVLPISESVFGVYLSLRSLPLLRSNGKDYEKFFCNILINKIKVEICKHNYQDLYFDSEPEVDQIQEKLIELSINTVGELAETDDEFILGLDSISYVWLNRIKSVVGQAIWM
jgi:hypothetical protein